MDKLNVTTSSHHVRISDYAWQKLVLIAKYDGLTVSKYLEYFARNKKFNM